MSTCPCSGTGMSASPTFTRAPAIVKTAFIVSRLREIVGQSWIRSESERHRLLYLTIHMNFGSWSALMAGISPKIWFNSQIPHFDHSSVYKQRFTPPLGSYLMADILPKIWFNSQRAYLEHSQVYVWIICVFICLEMCLCGVAMLEQVQHKRCMGI